ncbi:MAG: DEAD/DEAH box helicase family protein, partial [Verrucomicrobiales bacterium]|nr:DEAD/DEAH box helicase family protein [Verrucomicrobiales bacterium]
MFPVENKDERGGFYVENISDTQAMLRRLERLGFSWQERERRFEMKGGPAVMRFLASDLPVLEGLAELDPSPAWQRLSRGWIRVVPQLQTPSSSPRESGHSGSGGEWLTMEFSYQGSDGFRLSRADALRLLRSGNSVYHGKNGKKYLLDLAATEDLEQSLQDVPVELSPEGVRLDPRHQAYLLPREEREQLLRTRDAACDSADLQQRLPQLASVLRPYQWAGVGWLDQRRRDGQGAILADDMGLGKTLQSIALILLTRSETSNTEPVLVICPKSLIANWQSELERFAPSLKVLAVQGSNREAALESMHAHDVIITSYSLIFRDIEQYASTEFAAIIADEASFIRNPDTEAAKALRRLKGKMRLALTGTPVENSVRDLWSIYAFVLPGYLGTRSQFDERFVKPLESTAEPDLHPAGRRLRTLVRPFFLRRTKEQVLADLPGKVEQILWCDPSAAQAETYRRILEEGREEIRQARRRSGQAGARMTMLTVLLRLRQVCCDLRLAGLPDELTAAMPADERSAKWSALQERLDELTASDHKALIFSQFVQHLRLLREGLDGQKIGYSYLDGQTEDRGRVVSEFQKDPEKRVFLISLKAGGYGLNLTQADHVFLMDPWWNPAVEA